MKKTIVFLILIVALCETKKTLPQYIKTCSRTDPRLGECFAKNANFAMSFIAKGDKDYNINTLLPMKWKEELIVNMPPVTLYLIDIYIFGTENMTITDPIINFDEKRIQYTFTNPLIIWKSKFVANVKENGINIETKGHAEIHFKKGKFGMRFEYELQELNGVEYARITKSNADFLAVEMEFKLDNIDAHPIIKQEWEKAKENFLNDQIQVACGQIVGDCTNKIFTVVPFNEIFTDK